MKKIFSFIFLLSALLSFAQLDNIASGESLTYRIHYGILTAGSANLTATKTTYKNEPHFYVKGTGKTSGAVRAFFKVDDLYESYINAKTGLPSFYVRNVKEGSYSQHFETTFNHSNNTLILTDKKTPANGSKIINTVKGIQDMLSSFYYLRSLNQDELKTGSTHQINIWIDDEMFPFSLKILGTETIKTKFGKISCLKIRPQVMSGRVFKDNEGVTLWVSNDQNHIPISIKAQLAVGSLKADIDDYSGLMYNLNFSK